ncbi:MAG: recombinase family protein [Alteromonadaceae bacterium]|nr:recombinase family protein [Alteromonadaceae bacterium]
MFSVNLHEFKPIQALDCINLNMTIHKYELLPGLIGAQFIKEGLTFTGEDSPMSNLLLSVMGAFAEFERALIKERQREGIELAKKRGAYKGRKKSLSIDKIEQLKQRAANGEAKTHLAKEFGISRETLYQYLKSE